MKKNSINQVILLLFLAVTQSIMAQVGINTATPNETLHVNGTVQITNGIRLGGDATATDGTSSLGTSGQVITSDGTNARWTDISKLKGTVSNMYNLIGTTTATSDVGTSIPVPGLTQTITIPTGESRLLLINVSGYAIKAKDISSIPIGIADASQGIFEIYVDNKKLSAAFFSSLNSPINSVVSTNFITTIAGSNLLDLPIPVNFNSKTVLNEGTHTIEVRFKSWSQRNSVNVDATIYQGATADDVEALKSRLTITEFVN